MCVGTLFEDLDSPLMCAIRRGSMAMTKRFLEHPGVKINYQNKFGRNIIINLNIIFFVLDLVFLFLTFFLRDCRIFF
jgi:hypothetical protein